jgi:hypothetical protein
LDINGINVGKEVEIGERTVLNNLVKEDNQCTVNDGRDTPSTELNSSVYSNEGKNQHEGNKPHQVCEFKQCESQLTQISTKLCKNLKNSESDQSVGKSSIAVSEQTRRPPSHRSDDFLW